MRSLNVDEIELVAGGNPTLVVAAVVDGIPAATSLAVMALASAPYNRLENVTVAVTNGASSLWGAIVLGAQSIGDQAARVASEAREYFEGDYYYGRGGR